MKWGEKKTREGGERRGRTLGQEGWSGLNGRELGASHSGVELGTKIYGAKLGARVTGVELPAISPPRWLRAQELGARDAGAELRVQILKSFLQGQICEIFSKKG